MIHKEGLMEKSAKQLEKLKDIEKCGMCRKDFKTYKKCFMPYKMGKSKLKYTTQRLAPYIYVGKITGADTLLCRTCSQKILRFMGLVPEKYDSKTFPQIHSKPYDTAEEFIKSLSKKRNRDWQMSFKKQRGVKLDRNEYKRLLRKACVEYILKYPYSPYNATTLSRKIKSYKDERHPLEW